LAEDGAEGAEGDLFSVCRDDDCMDWFFECSEFYMTTFLGNKNKAYAKQGFDDMFR
jgi:hypothetical protein